ncbi:molybdopterin-dependent oxidoreductase [Streptomyces sp. DH37]|uniref:molybdopterin-dependent oxidoreductase n=1 Tax=Streptomyces sp. DH37 TaxID=3040122 RepID=UPI0024423D3D|nr:molybdopterin-dependent oxidoreductase [Streptomyces sp. DH37]MDG9700949.1 molybdopterin-dependent oxidoreductase [Streptomyces sp. DH37]
MGPTRRTAPFRFRGGPHDPRTATALGRRLGAAVLVCFVTGLAGHVLQEPPDAPADRLPPRPVRGYRLTHGVHVAAGIALVPLLLAKLWAVYPRLYVRPAVRSPLHALERLSVAVLVASALLEVFLGLMNTAQWYVWPFSFRRVHWAPAWVLTGSLLPHPAVKAPVIAAHRRSRSAGTRALPASGAGGRRSLLRGVGAAVGAVTAVTAGQTLAPLRPLVLLAPRRPDIGPQGLPVNRTAAAAGVTDAVVRDWRLVVDGPRPYTLTPEEPAGPAQREVELPIACVEGWSASARWGGVRLRDLLERAGAPAGARVRVVSLQRRGAYAVTEMGAAYARDPLTLPALRVNGEALSRDHGRPARVIAPNRPGVLQTKWVSRLEVL